MNEKQSKHEQLNQNTEEPFETEKERLKRELEELDAAFQAADIDEDLPPEELYLKEDWAEIGE